MRSRVYRSAYFWSYFRPGVAIFYASFQICNNQYDDNIRLVNSIMDKVYTCFQTNTNDTIIISYILFKGKFPSPFPPTKSNRHIR